MRKGILLLILFLSFTACRAQVLKADKIEPPNWWAGMKWNKLQLMVYGTNLNNIKAKFDNGKIRVLKVHNAESTSYSFIDIEIPNDLTPGTYKLILEKNKSIIEVDYPILKLSSTAGKYQGFNSDDVIYLITPDRFADGDTANNIVKGTIDEYDVAKPISRHGGDIEGIINHLDYLKNLGVTALWINPLIENNTFISYHGYSATDFYKIDPRFGTNDLYKRLVEDAHAEGLKIIWDHVSNHISIDHPWMKDLPFKSWINGTVKNHMMTKHDKLAFADIHRDSSTIYNTTHGWFTNYMPDLNQTNQFVSNYLIENTLWWIESTGIDGIREDTYPYSDQKYLSNWAKAILSEFPELNIVGEVWTGDAVFLSSFQRDSYYPAKLNSNLPTVTDFATYDTYTSFLRGKSGLYNIYEDFAKDFIYRDSQNLLTFIDNHDVARAMYQANGNIKKLKMALMMLLTSRGIPEIFYGTEIGIVGGKDDGLLRANFPGGFPGDKRNAFSSVGRTDDENDIFSFVHRLLIERRDHKSLSSGKLTQFPPENNIFVYFKNDEKDRAMIIMNDNEQDKEVDLKPYSDQLKDVRELKDLMTGKVYEIAGNDSLKVESNSGNIFQLIK